MSEQPAPCRRDPSRGAFALALAALAVAVAAIFALMGAGEDDGERAARAPAPLDETVFKVARPLPSAEVGERVATVPPEPLRSDASGFFESYQRFYYGLTTGIENASPELRRRLVEAGPNTAPAIRGLVPRVRALRVERADRGLRVTASVADGEGVFPVAFVFAERGGRWVAVERFGAH